MGKSALILQKIFIGVTCLTLTLAVVLIMVTPRPVDAPKDSHAEQAGADVQLPLAEGLTRILFAGDIMLSRDVGAAITRAQDPLLPFNKVSEVIRSADISFANLESPFSDKPTVMEAELVFKASPEYIQGLLSAGFDVLSTANNHAYDQGVYGVTYTYNWLKEHGILPSGSNPEKFDPTEAIIQKNDIRFAFLSYTYSAANRGGDSSPLIGNFNDPEQMQQDIRDIKGRNADVLVVSMHAGQEYERDPGEKQKEFARKAIDAGADLVIGHHPHWAQTVEEYKDKWILYSLGNFVFDQMWSRDTREGLTALATFEKHNLVKLELLPVVIDNYCCPRWANEAEKAAILKKIHLTTPILMNNN